MCDMTDKNDAPQEIKKNTCTREDENEDRETRRRERLFKK